jgi:hypothetical protein
LDDDGDGTGGAVEISDGKWNAFTVLVDAGHNEMAGSGSAGHVRRVDLPKEGRRTELLPAIDEKHSTPWKPLW